MSGIKGISKREKRILILTAAIIVFKLCYELALTPFIQKITSMNNEIAQLQNKLTKSKRLLFRKDEIEKRFSALATGLKSDESLSNEQQITRILVELEQLGNKAGIHINDIKPQPFKRNDYYSEIIIELRLEAGLKELTNFLYRIQQSGELLTVEKLEIGIQSQDSAFLYGYLEIHKIML